MHIQLTGYYGINCYRYCSCKNIVTIYLGAGFGLFIIQDGKVYHGESQLYLESASTLLAILKNIPLPKKKSFGCYDNLSES